MIEVIINIFMLNKSQHDDHVSMNKSTMLPSGFKTYHYPIHSTTGVQRYGLLLVAQDLRKEIGYSCIYLFLEL